MHKVANLGCSVARLVIRTASAKTRSSSGVIQAVEFEPQTDRPDDGEVGRASADFRTELG